MQLAVVCVAPCTLPSIDALAYAHLQHCKPDILCIDPTGAELERLRGLFFCFTSYMQHGGNAVLVLVEFVLNDIR